MDFNYLVSSITVDKSLLLLVDSKIRFEIDYFDSSNPRHIVLGNVNIIYASSDESIYKILNGNELLLEIENYLNK